MLSYLSFFLWTAITLEFFHIYGNIPVLKHFLNIITKVLLRLNHIFLSSLWKYHHDHVAYTVHWCILMTKEFIKSVGFSLKSEIRLPSTRRGGMTGIFLPLKNVFRTDQ